jgi:hypothetical protein
MLRLQGSDLQNSDRAGQYFQDSIRYYTDWGSDYKAEILRKKYSHLWTDEIPLDITVIADIEATPNVHK